MFLRLSSCQLNLTTKQCSNPSLYGGTLDLVENFILQSYDTKYADTLISIGQTLAPNTNSRTSHSGLNIDQNTREGQTKETKRCSWINVGSSAATGPSLGTVPEGSKKIITVFARDTFQRLIYSEQLIGTG